MSRCLLFFFFFCVIAPKLGAQGNNPALKKVVDRLIKFEMSRDLDQVPGYILGIMEGDSTYYYGYGTKEKGQEIVPDAHTLFEAGSVSKLITSAIIYRMVDAGELRLEDTLGMYLEGLPSIHHLSILSLLNHSSGLPRLPYNFGASAKNGSNPFESYQYAHLASFLGDFRLNEEEIGVYNYSHLSYAILQYLLEKKVGADMDAISRKWLFDPLGMEDSYFSKTRKDSADQVTGYSLMESPERFWQTQFFSASVGMKTSVHDLMQFVQAFHRTDSLGASLRKTIEPTLEKNKHMDIAAGWHLIVQPDFYSIRGHSGATDGCSAYVGYIPETQTAVAVLANSEIKVSKLGALTLQLMNFNWNKKKMKKVMKDREMGVFPK